MRRLTLKFKQDHCQKCKQSDKNALNAGEPYCSLEYKPIRDGQCQNFKKR